MSRTARAAALGLAAGLLALYAGAAGAAAPEAPTVVEAAGPTRTGKERLGAKADDEQRIDDCKVAAERRGGKERPDGCGEGAGAR